MRMITALLVCCLVFAVASTSLLRISAVATSNLADYSGGIQIFGLVDHPLNLTDADMLSMPMVSETATVQCVWYNVPGNPIPTITVNWTGVPLFYLLTLAQVRSEAFKVVFNSRDGNFFDTLNIQSALDPKILLALYANGTLLTTTSSIYPGHIGGYRIVVPGRWGYKWVANVGSIEVVDHDVLGTYETDLLQSDDAINGAPSSAIAPPVQTYYLMLGNRTFQFSAFTNTSLINLNFRADLIEIDVDLSIPLDSTGFADFIVQQNMLAGPYSLSIDGIATNFTEADVAGNSYLYVLFAEGLHHVAIVGTEFTGAIPTIVMEPISQTVHVNDPVVFNASRSMDEGVIVSYRWNFGDGSEAFGAVVSHIYSKPGAYQVELNVTDNIDLSASETFSVDVQVTPLNVVLIIQVGVLISAILLAISFALLVSRRKGTSSDRGLASAPERKIASHQAVLSIDRHPLPSFHEHIP